MDFLLCRQPGDPRAQQREKNQSLARRLATSVSAVYDPSGSPSSDGVEGSGSQSLVEFST